MNSAIYIYKKWGTVNLWLLSWILLAGGAPILTSPSWLWGRLQGGETTTFGFNNIKIMRQRNAVANTWSNMHVEPAAWPGEWRAQMKIMKINKLWKFVIIFLLLSFILYLKKIKKIITLFICIATHLWIYIFIPALFKGNVPSSTILIYK